MCRMFFPSTCFFFLSCLRQLNSDFMQGWMHSMKTTPEATVQPFSCMQ